MLLSRPECHSDESAAGYLVRLAEANGYRHPRQLVHMAGARSVGGAIHSYVDWLNEHDGQLSSLIGLTAQQILSRKDTVGSRYPGLRFLIADKARFCPLCLQESYFWRVAWEHAFCIHCPRHSVLLISSCSDCGNKLSAWRPSLKRCKCGAALALQPAESLSPGRDKGLALASALLERSGALLPMEVEPAHEALSPDFQILSAARLHQVVFLFGSYAEFSQLRHPRKANLKLNPAHAWRCLTAAASVMEDWPKGFHRLLARQMNRSSSAQGFRDRFGHLYRAIYRELNGADCEFIRRAFEAFLQEHWDEVLSGRNRRLSDWLKQTQHYVPASVIVRMLGVPRHVIGEAIRNKKIDGSILILPSGRQRIIVAKSSLAIIPSLYDAMDLKTAMAALGLPERRVIELVDADIVKGKRPSAGESWKINRPEIEKLLSRFRSSASRVIPAAQGMVTLRSALCHYLKPDLSFIHFMDALLGGVIQYEWDQEATSLSDIRLDKLQLRSWLQRDDGLLGIPKLAILLGIKQEVAYHLVRKNLISSEDHGRSGRYVTQDSIDRFRRRYVLARDLANMLKTSPRSLIHRLTAAGVVPATGPDIDGCRQVIYSVSSLQTIPLPAPVRDSLQQLAQDNHVEGSYP